MFQIKICGITSSQDAQVAADAGADAIGLNFYEPSPRSIPIDQAGPIIAATPPHMTKVGLFVNADHQAVCDVYDRLGLDLLQLHGDEPPEYLARLGGRPVIRAFRCGKAGLKPVGQYIAACRKLACEPLAVLLDAYQPGRYGGTGKSVDWNLAGEADKLLSGMKIVLAGGLNPTNVQEAIRVAKPTAVDIASGVETAPGEKNPALVRAFVTAAKAAFANIRQV